MRRPDLLDSFIFRGEKVKVEWFDVSSKKDIPDISWVQVYAIGDLDGRVPVVVYDDAKDNLPGGHTEDGETVEQTLRRELIEEINCDVIDWQPIGYQITSNAKYGTEYALRVYAKLKKRGEFVFDPGGPVKGYKLVNLDDLNSYIKYGKTGDRMIELVKKIV